MLELPEAVPAEGGGDDDDRGVGVVDLALGAWETRWVRARLRGSRLRAATAAVAAADRTMSWSLSLRNARNPHNVAEFIVTAEVTTLQLKYHNLHWAGLGRAANDPRVADEAPGASLDAPPHAVAAGLSAAAADEGQLPDALVDRALATAHAALLAAGHPPPVGALTLPALISPSADAPSSEAAFALHNASGKALRLELRPQPLTAAAIAAAGGSGSGGATLSSGAAGSLRLDLELLSQHSGTPLSSLLTLAAGERLDLIVRARLPTAVALVCTFGQPLVFGSLAVRSFVSGLDADGWGAAAGAVASTDGDTQRVIDDTIALVGCVRRGEAFSINVSQLHFSFASTEGDGASTSARLPPWSYQLSPQMSSSPPPQTESLWIRNLLTDGPIEVDICTTVPLSIARVSVRPARAQIAPGGEVQVLVMFEPRPAAAGAAVAATAPGAAEMHLQVSDSSGRGSPKLVRITLVKRDQASVGVGLSLPRSGTDGDSASDLDTFALDGLASPPSLVGLRNVTPVAGSVRRYELNLGQQNYASGAVQWELGVENLGERSLRYRLFALNTEEGAEWLSLSHTEGTLAGRHETHMVTLSCSTQHMEIYQAYIVVENIDNPDDLKTIRVSMEMIVSDASAASYFSIIVDGERERRPEAATAYDSERRALAERTVRADGAHKELRMNMGDVYYDVLYVNRSFVVENLSSMPLDFVISHNLPRSSPTEVNFSLTNTSLKVFSTLLVPAHSSTRVFLHFRTSAPPAAKLSAAASVLELELSVSCRFVKDHRQLIHLAATCHPPRLGLSLVGGIASPPADDHQEQRLQERLEIAFSTPPLDGASVASRVASSAAIDAMVPRAAVIRVFNVGGPALTYAVRSSCAFFDVKAEAAAAGAAAAGAAAVGAAAAASGAVARGRSGALEAECQLGEGDAREHLITVVPNTRALISSLPFLSKTRYVEEHFTVYNCDDLNEHRCVLVRLSCGRLHHQSFSYAPSRFTYGYSLLEEDILRFHGAFKTFWEDALPRLHRALAGAARLPAVPAVAASTADDATPSAAAAAAPDAVTRPAASDFAAAAPDVTAATTYGGTSLEDGAIAPESVDLAMARVAAEPAYRQLWFDFRRITDELVFYGMRAQTSHFVSPLANLCYKLLFQHHVFRLLGPLAAAAAAAAPAAPPPPPPQQQRAVVEGPTAALELGDDRLGIDAGGRRGVLEAAPLAQQLHLWVKQLSYFLMHFPGDSDYDGGGIEPLRRLERSLCIRNHGQK